MFVGQSKHIDLRVVSGLRFPSGAIAMRYQPIR